MKRPFSTILSYWRVALSGTFLSAAVATAFVAGTNSGLLTSSSSNPGVQHRVLKKSMEYGLASRNEGYGEEGAGEDPEQAAAEDYANRSYPADYVPFSFTLNAQAAWAKIKSQKNKNKIGNWTLAGPSTANFPAVLTFSGAAYTTSGRITALAIGPTCTTNNCTLWVAAAGGGVWRTNNALSGSGPNWTFLSGNFKTNAIGTLTYDATTSTLYAGTGEAHSSADSEAGFGIYKSTDQGNTWVQLAANTTVPSLPTSCGPAPAYTGPAFDGRAIGSIAVRGNTMYVGSTRAVRGVSSVSSGGAVTLAPGLPPYGLFKSTDGGANFTLLAPEGVCLNPLLAGDAGKIQASFGSARGVPDADVDPNYATNTTVYAGVFPRVAPGAGGGVWRTTDDGATFTQILSALAPTNINDRPEISVTKLSSGLTRIYVGIGNTGAPTAKLYRTDDATAAVPVFTDLTAAQSPAGQTSDYCTAQCWYDNTVYSPPGYPDVVYLGGSYQYGEYGGKSNSRGLVYSTDAGASFTDVSWDASSSTAPNGMHPDHHAVVTSPSNPGLFFNGSDGGLMRSSGSFADISSQCTSRGLTGSDLALCQQLLSRVPTFLYSLNKGLSTLQFQSLSVAADNYKHLQGGTQDNGTFETYGSSVVWPQIIYGDGGQSGFNVGNSVQRFNNFFAQYTDANFQNGDPTKWVVISGPLFAESSQFYKPMINDPTVAGTIFVGELSVWRSQAWGGNQAYLEANCPEFTTSGSDPNCGDFVKIGNGVPSTQLTSSSWGDRSGGNVAAVERAPGDTGTLWAATTLGRLFISKNADAAAGSVVWTRLDSTAANDPARFISGIYPDPADANHAWVSYSSYSSLTPTEPGHIFSVTYNPTGGTATWTNLDGTGATMFPDFPATDVVHDTNGDLYASNDWGVLRLVGSNPANGWTLAGNGLPQVEVAGLTIVSSARKLYAATHGRSAWQLTLP